MIGFYTFIAIYLFGGLTFLPLLLYGALYLVSAKGDEEPEPRSPVDKNAYPDEPYSDVDKEQGKKGLIRLSNFPDGQPNGRWNTNASTPASKRPKDWVYGVLKHGTLFVYESEQLVVFKMIIPIHDYTISIYPEGRREHELFGRSTAIRLTPKQDRQRRMLEADTELLGSHCSLGHDIYLTCPRAIDKEDWYFALIAASKFMADTPEVGHVETMDGTHFDIEAIKTIIRMIHQDQDQREVKWFNAVIGRLFLGVYKTEKVDRFLKNKIAKKVQKVKRPVFLDEITVHRVHVGQTIPYFSRFKLISLDMDGHLIAEAQMDYAGGLCVEIGTGFILPGYSSRLKPIRLLLSVTLKRFSGKFQFKIKPPPTNRVWFGFYGMPQMDWDIKPIVSDKHIKLNVVINAIENKIKEVIGEALVLPNMDDFVFFFTEEGSGGIFGKPVPRPVDLSNLPQKEDIEAGSTASSSSSSSSGSLPEIDQHDQHMTSKSAPDLLKPAASTQSSTVTAAGNSTDAVSVHSVDSVDSAATAFSSSSSMRWAIRRKKKVSSEPDVASEESSIRRRSFLSKISPLHETAASNAAIGSERRSSLSHKEYTPSPAREENPRIAKFPPPPPPPFHPSKPAPQDLLEQRETDLDQKRINAPEPEAAGAPEVPVSVIHKPPLPPRRPHAALSASTPVNDEYLPPAPPPALPRRRSTSLGQKPSLPPRSPRLSDVSPSPQPRIASPQSASSSL
ncbi:putative integral membrane protein conserved region-domain-containing protein [Dichotomocladium elegans]|nr:putative integral membrane protein conserved region-domain-containing protein [Dichotomocladium elegans]